MELCMFLSQCFIVCSLFASLNIFFTYKALNSLGTDDFNLQFCTDL